MADEVLKKIAENKIKELEKEVLVLKAELRSMESFNSAAWEMYGSELCAGEMTGNENKIRVKMDLIRCDIIYLRRFIEGRLDISREERLKTNSAQIDAQILTLQDSQRLIDEELSEIAVVKTLLAVTF